MNNLFTQGKNCFHSDSYSDSLYAPWIKNLYSDLIFFYIPVIHRYLYNMTFQSSVMTSH